jgi:NAD(P)-dependent dehydrogenase (short-subunit alcohol dehydrogenase family)
MATTMITGANGGLGIFVTENLLGKGIRVIAVSGKAGAGELKAHPYLVSMEADLLSEEDTEDLAACALRDYNDLDSAVLLVGGFAMGKLADTSNEDLDRMIRLNFYTALNLVRPLLRHFLQRPGGGRFVLVGSRPGLDAAAGKDFFAYSLSKAMVFKLAEFINAEGKGRNVDAAVIVPSTIDTEANRKSMPDGDFSKWVTPEAIAETISFYLSPEGRMIREAIVKVYNRS